MIRSPLLLLVFEWEDELKRWKQSQKRLKKAVKKAHAKVAKRLKKVERLGPGESETPEQFGNRLLNRQDTIRKKIFDKRRTRLVGLQGQETAHFNDYERALRPTVVKMRPIRRRR